MELNQALKLLIELAQQNVIEDDELEAEATRQQAAIDTVQAHVDELENPSPIQAVMVTEGGVVHEVFSNVPLNITLLDGDLEGAESGNVRYINNLNQEYYVSHPGVACDPIQVAQLLADANE